MKKLTQSFWWNGVFQSNELFQQPFPKPSLFSVRKEKLSNVFHKVPTNCHRIQWSIIISFSTRFMRMLPLVFINPFKSSPFYFKLFASNEHRPTSVCFRIERPDPLSPLRSLKQCDCNKNLEFIYCLRIRFYARLAILDEAKRKYVDFRLSLAMSSVSYTEFQ